MKQSHARILGILPSDERVHHSTLCAQQMKSGGRVEPSTNHIDRGIIGPTQHGNHLGEIFVGEFGNRMDGECGEQAMSKIHFRIPSTRCVWVDILTQRTHKVSPGFSNPPWHLIPKMLTFLEEATHYKVLLVVPYHPLKPWWHKFQSMTQMTITIYQATYQLPDRVAVKARQPVICGWLCKTTSDSKEPPKKKSRRT